MQTQALRDQTQDSNKMSDIKQIETPITTSTTTTSVYRFKLQPHIVEAVTRFAKIHQYDKRCDYKEAWKLWCEEEGEMIQREINRLMNIGYEGDVIDKMYKAGRYYFRNKKMNEDKEPKKRRHYVSMDSAILEAMDEHIAACFENNDFTPANGYDWFVNQYTPILGVEIKRLLEEEPELKASYISSKIKKTYKNRYYLFASNQN